MVILKERCWNCLKLENKSVGDSEIPDLSHFRDRY